MKNVFIEKNIFNWAIEESGFSKDCVTDKFRFVSDVINGSGITINQAKQLANFLKIPLGFLFLKEKPLNCDFNVEFRTIGNKQNNNLSKDLKDVLLDMDFKKNWMNSFRKSLEYEKILDGNIINLNNSSLQNASIVRKFLEIDDNWFRNTKPYSNYQFLKLKLENKGFVVMSSGIVGQNTRRKLNINEFRGFALYDEYAPLIFINSSDNLSAESFTLIHEMIHLLSNRNDDILNEKDGKIERLVNDIVAEVLMPENYIFNLTKNIVLNEKKVHELASYFRVNDFAIAYRLYNLNLIGFDLFEYFSKKAKERAKAKSSGGDYYATYCSKMSNTFVEAVFESINTNYITYIEGIRLLGINSRVYSKIGDFVRYRNEVYN